MHKVTGRRALLRAKPIALAVAAILPAGAAFAQTAPNTVPTNGTYTAGTGTIQPVTPENHLRVDQASQKGIIEWGTFSIGSAASVHFQHAFDRQGLTLNRVITPNSPSEIFGRLTSNGQLFLVNNAGVLFAPGASVSAAALVASTLSITDQNFLNGNYVFENPGNAGSVVNRGSIVTAGGYTALIGPQVRNDGVILANSGKVALGAGDRVTLDIVGDGLVSISVDQAAFNASVINTGTLQADNGTVMLKASSMNALLDTVINTSGVIRASGLGLENGQIVLHGGDVGTVQVSGLVQAESGRIDISAGGALNVGSTVCCSPTTIIAATQEISAGSVTVGGGAQIIGNTGAGSQTITTPGTLLVRGGVLSGNVGIFHNGSGEQRVTAGNVEVRGGIGTNTAAFISNAGGDQTITVTGELRVTGGPSGTGNRAGIVSSGNQTINGNPDIVLTGGAGGGAGNASNNVFIQATGPDTTQQTINARTIRLNSGTGVDASATFNAARQVITTIGDVSIFGGAGPGGSNGARIGGIGGTTLGPTNLMLSVGGDLLLHGGTANGASLGSSGASTQSNTITVTANNVTLESEGAGARIGSSSQVGATPGNITVTAGESFQLGNGTAVRANGPITLTANGLANDGTITNGGGANSANMILNANAFDLAGGNIQGGAAAVILRPRDGTHSFGIEAAGDTTLTNADIASINTSNFVVFGSGIGTTFTGNMMIGENAQVNGGGKHLAFFRGTVGGTTTIGSQGVATTGDVIVGAGGGAIQSNGGTVRGDEVQLRAGQSIGASGARVQTAANALAINSGNAFVSELDSVTLRDITLNVGGITNVGNNVLGGTLDLTAGGALNVAGTVLSIGQNINVAGALTLDGTTQDAVLQSGAGQSITAQSITQIGQNNRRANIVNTTIPGGNQTVTTTGGGLTLQGNGGAGVAQIINNAPGGNQTITVNGQLTVIGGATSTGSTNSGIFKNQAGGMQTVKASGITLQGASSGTNAGALIVSRDEQLVDVTGGNINLIGGGGGTVNNASISALQLTPTSPVRKQTIRAHDISLTNSSGGTDTVAGIFGSDQTINATGNVTLTSGGALVGGAAGGPGVRIGAPGGTTTGTKLDMTIGGNLVLNGGTANENGAAIGSSGAGVPQQNNITIDAGGSVILNAGTAQNTGVRIGSGSSGTAGGNITILADGSIQLNGTQRSAAIRTLDNVTLEAAAISEAGNGFILANTLTTRSTGGDTTLTGPNQVSSFNGSSSGDLSLTNTGALTVTGLNAGGDATLTNTGAVNVTSPWFSSGLTSVEAAGGGLTVTNSLTSLGAMTLEVGGTLTVSANGPQTASVQSSGGQTITAQSVEVVAQNGGFASIFNNGGDQRITINGGGTGAGLDVHTLASGGVAQIGLNTPGFTQAIEVTDANHININGAGPSPLPGPATGIFAFGSTQTLSITGSGANAVTVGSLGARGASNVGAGFTQSITAGLAGQQGSITIVGSDAQGALAGFVSNPNTGGTQTVSTSGTISITGGRAPAQLGNFPAGIFHNGTGQQTINAASLVLTGGPSGNNNAALINVPGGGIPANAAVQVINVSGDITIAGGPGGNAGILGSASRLQTVRANNISLTNSAGGGINSVGFIQGGHQDIGATGNVTLTARASGGDLPGVRIGGLAGNNPTATDLTLHVGGDLILTGGTAVNNGVGIGSTGAAGAPALANDITITTGGSVILNAGTLAGTGVRIGSSANTGTGPGDISIAAGGDIQLNGVDQTAAIRTLDTVTLNAANISEGPRGLIIAGTLNTTTSGNTLLTGPNGVANFSGLSTTGDVTLNNSGALNVTALNAFNAALTNNGDVTVSGPWNSFGTTAITTIGAGSDLTVTNNVTSNGAMNVNVAGDIAVTAGGAQTAMLRSFGGQNIDARSLAVTSNDGRFAAVWNTGPNAQTIHLTNGAGLDVQTLSPGGFAQVSADAGGNQTINVVNGDHINVNGASGAAVISNFGGTQTLSITGSGANAITLGAAGSLGPSQVFGGAQNVTAGAGGESGSITIVGGNGNATFTGVSSGQIIGGTQTVATSGTLRISGGDAPNQPPSGFATGLFHNGSGEQRVSAANLEMQGGSSGVNNLAIIISSGGAGTIASGSQVIDVAGGNVELTGGSGGTNNTAIIVSFADQTLAGGSVQLTGGAGGVSNNAFINIAGPGGGVGRTQTIDAGTIDIVSGANSPVGITAAKQVITTVGDLRITGNPGDGVSSGARIGGAGGAVPGSSDMTLRVGGDLLLTAGGTNNPATIGAPTPPAGVAPPPHVIDIQAQGDVIVRASAKTGARIGTSFLAPSAATGNISITAGRSIQLHGFDPTLAPAGIRTASDVALVAGTTILETGSGMILANRLTTTSTGDTSLTGPNQVSSFTASSETGNVSLRNTAPVLTLGSMELPGSLSIVQAGTLSIPGTVSALSHAIEATGDVLVGSAGATDAALLYASNGISISTPGSVVVRGSDVRPLGASAVLAEGNLRVAAGNVSIVGGGALLAPAVMRGEAVEMSVGSELHVTGGSGHLSPAVLSSGSNIDLTVGTAVRVTEGKGLLSLARIQTEVKDGVIHISFPNLEEGGYFVNGIEGKTHHGQTGFFTMNKPAKVGKTLLLEYGD